MKGYPIPTKIAEAGKYYPVHFSWQLEKLPEDARAIVALIFQTISVDGLSAYMIEVKIDGAAAHLLSAPNDNVNIRLGCRHREHAEHYGDPGWAVIHVTDVDWAAQDFDGLFRRAVQMLKETERRAVDTSPFRGLLN